MVLVVEDDSIIAEGLKLALTGEGMEVTLASSVAEAYAALENEEPGKKIDFCLLDMTLPDGNGMDICMKVRETSEMPIIFLTAMDDEIHTVLAFDKGADDYISKPFRPRELLSRIRNVLRYYGADSSVVSLGGGVTADTEKGVVSRNGEPISLSALEYRLLLVFIDNRGRLLTRNKLLEDIWDIAGDFVNDNTLTVYIKRLREKIEEDPQDPKIIKTVRGIGYRMD